MRTLFTTSWAAEPFSADMDGLFFFKSGASGRIGGSPMGVLRNKSREYQVPLKKEQTVHWFKRSSTGHPSSQATHCCHALATKVEDQGGPCDAAQKDFWNRDVHPIHFPQMEILGNPPGDPAIRKGVTHPLSTYSS